VGKEFNGREEGKSVRTDHTNSLGGGGERDPERKLANWRRCEKQRILLPLGEGPEEENLLGPHPKAAGRPYQAYVLGGPVVKSLDTPSIPWRRHRVHCTITSKPTPDPKDQFKTPLSSLSFSEKE